MKRNEKKNGINERRKKLSEKLKNENNKNKITKKKKLKQSKVE